MVGVLPEKSWQTTVVGRRRRLRKEAVFAPRHAGGGCGGDSVAQGCGLVQRAGSAERQASPRQATQVWSRTHQPGQTRRSDTWLAPGNVHTIQPATAGVLQNVPGDLQAGERSDPGCDRA